MVRHRDHDGQAAAISAYVRWRTGLLAGTAPTADTLIAETAAAVSRPRADAEAILGQVDAALGQAGLEPTGAFPPADPDDAMVGPTVRAARTAGLLGRSPTDVDVVVQALPVADSDELLDAIIRTRTCGFTAPPGGLPDARIGRLVITTGPVGARDTRWRDGRVSIVSFDVVGPVVAQDSRHFLDELVTDGPIRPWRIAVRPRWTAHDLPLDGTDPRMPDRLVDAARRSANSGRPAIVVRDPDRDGLPTGWFPPPQSIVPLIGPGRVRRRRGLGHLTPDTLHEAVTARAVTLVSRRLSADGWTGLHTDGCLIAGTDPTGRTRTVWVAGSTGLPADVPITTDPTGHGVAVVTGIDLHAATDPPVASGGRIDRLDHDEPGRWVPTAWAIPA